MRRRSWNLGGEKTAFSIEEGDEYGVIATGPYWKLPAGRYKLQYHIGGDGENVISLRTTNDVRCVPEEIRTVPGEWVGELEFELPETGHNFHFVFEFSDGTWIETSYMRLYSPYYSDETWSAAFVIAALLALWLCLRLRLLDREGLGILAVLVAAVILSSVYALQEDSFGSWDTAFHAARIYNLADSLKAGQFPGRVGGYSYNGYGAATPIFYPDLFLYPLALLSFCGVSQSWLLNCFFMTISILAAVCMYFSAKRILESREEALVAAVLYEFSAFRYHVTASQMFGMMIACAVLPLFLLGLWEVVFGEKRRWPLLTVGAMLIFYSHLLSCFFALAMALCIGLGYLPKILREKRLDAIGKAIGFSLLIGAAGFCPLLDYLRDGVVTTPTLWRCAEQTISIGELFRMDDWLGIALWLGVAAFLAYEAQLEKRNEQDRFFLFLIAMSAGVIVFVVNSRPWSYLSAWTNGLSDMMQFPWRLLMPVAACLSLCAARGFCALLSANGFCRGCVGLLALAVCVVTMLPKAQEFADSERRIVFGECSSPYLTQGEYQFEGTDLDITRRHQPEIDGALAMTGYIKDGTRVRAEIEASGESELSLPLFAFKGYEATLNGQKLETRRGTNNRLTVLFDAGMKGELRVRFRTPPLWHATDAVSLLAALALAVMARGSRRARRQS